MGLMDKVKGLLGQHDEHVDKGIDRTGDMVDDKTGGKYAEHVDKGQQAAQDHMDKLGGADGGDPGDPGAQP